MQHKKTRQTSFSRSRPRVDLIFNSVSGTRDPDADLSIILTALHKSFDKVVVWNTTAENGGDTLGRQALADGATILVACGGDGTVATVASALKHVMHHRRQHNIPIGEVPLLGVIPRGTANALCAALDIPTNLKRAAEMVAGGNVRRLDFPTVSHPQCVAPPSMLLLCGIGLEAETVSRADRGMKRAWGTAAYALAGIASTWKQSFFKTDIVLYDVDDSLPFAHGRTTAKKMHLKDMNLKGVTVANAAPATSVLAQGLGTVIPDDGLLEVICVAAKTNLGMIRTMFSMLRAGLLRRRESKGNVFGLRARTVEISCEPPQRIVIDGEDAGVTPITISLDSDSEKLCLIAPKAGTVNRRRRKLSRSLIRLWRNVRGVAVLAVTVALLKKTRNAS